MISPPTDRDGSVASPSHSTSSSPQKEEHEDEEEAIADLIAESKDSNAIMMPSLAMVPATVNRHVKEVAKNTVGFSEMQRMAATTKLADDLKALREEKQTYHDQLAPLTPRSRRKHRFEIRCNLYKVKWDQAATKIQALVR